MTLTWILLGIVILCAVAWAVARSKRKPVQMRTLTTDEQHNVRALKSAGDRAGAIKFTRGRTGMGLVEARSYVDAL